VRTLIRPLLVTVTAAAAAVLVSGPPASAGCLAPSDVAIDGNGTVGPLWGSDSGRLLYSRALGGRPELVRRGLGEFPETIAREGDQNGFLVGIEEETWVNFHAGAINDRGDAAFIASTSLPDDPMTVENEALAQKGAYVRRGNTNFELGRHGGLSPVKDTFGDPVPWASFFDAVPLGNPGGGTVEAMFIAQLDAPDGRQGIFHWSQLSGTVTPVVLTGQPSPAGGNYTTFGRLRCNEAGDVVFYALTQVSPSAPIAPGLFRIAADALPPAAPTVTRIVRFGTDGDDVTGVGRLGLMQDFDLDADGNVYFACSVTGGPAAPSSLLRWDSQSFQVSRLLREGDATPLGGTFLSLLQTQVRCDASGTVTIMSEVSDELGGFVFVALPPDGSVLTPLGTSFEPLGIASLGDGRIAYQTATETRVVLPADGSEDGPKDFRVALVDVRNSPVVKKDGLVLDAQFRLPPWGTGDGQLPPAAFASDAERVSAEHRFGANELGQIAEVRVKVSQSPGQTWVFALGGTSAQPTGTLTVNSTPGTVSRVKLSKQRDVVTFRFSHATGAGALTVDLTRGRLRLTATRGNLFPSFEPTLFPVEMTLRTGADVVANRTGDAAYFHRSVRLDADQPRFGNGRRVRSRGERPTDGTFFVDSLRVDRRLRVLRGQSDPQVTSDRVRLNATLRLCPGASPPATPNVVADVTVGDLDLPGLELRRVGRVGSKYVSGRLKVDGVTVSLVVDAIRGRVSFSAQNVPPLSQLVNADFTNASDTNSSRLTVGGMTLPVHVRIDRVYETEFDAAIVRKPGGRVFQR